MKSTQERATSGKLLKKSEAYQKHSILSKSNAKNKKMKEIEKAIRSSNILKNPKYKILYPKLKWCPFTAPKPELTESGRTSFQAPATRPRTPEVSRRSSRKSRRRTPTSSTTSSWTSTFWIRRPPAPSTSVTRLTGRAGGF